MINVAISASKRKYKEFLIKINKQLLLLQRCGIERIFYFLIAYIHYGLGILKNSIFYKGDLQTNQKILQLK